MITTVSKLEPGDRIWAQAGRITDVCSFNPDAGPENILGPRVSFGEKIWVWDDDFEEGDEVVFIGITPDRTVYVAFGKDRGGLVYKNYCLLSRKPQEKVKPGDVFEDKEGKRWYVTYIQDGAPKLWHLGTQLSTNNVKGFTYLGPFAKVYQEKPKA